MALTYYVTLLSMLVVCIYCAYMVRSYLSRLLIALTVIVLNYCAHTYCVHSYCAHTYCTYVLRLLIALLQLLRNLIEYTSSVFLLHIIVSYIYYVFMKLCAIQMNLYKD